MTDYHSSLSSSSPQVSQESLPESSQSLNITPDEKAGTIPGSAVVTAVALSLRLLQVNVLEYETYKVHERLSITKDAKLPNLIVCHHLQKLPTTRTKIPFLLPLSIFLIYILCAKVHKAKQTDPKPRKSISLD